MRILGLDLSIASTGWAVHNDGVPTAYGTVATEVGDLPPRLFRITRNINLILNTYEPDHVFIEDVVASKEFPMTAVDLAKLHGAVLFMLFAKSITPVYVRQQTWKKHVLGSARKDKKDIRKWVADTFNIKLRTKEQDQADAICISRYGYLVCEGRL